jgi:hypothetical protein
VGAQQGVRVRGGQRADLEAVRPVLDGEATQLVPARDEDRAARRPRQQVLDVVRVEGVVQQDQRAAAGQHRTVEPGPLGRLARDVGGRHAEAAEQPGERVLRFHRPVRAVAAEVHVQLAVGEQLVGLVRPVRDQGCLADTGRPGDADDRRGRAARVHDLGQLGQFRGAPREAGRAGGQLARYLPGARRVRLAGPLGVGQRVGEHAHGAGAGPAGPPVLDVADRASAHAGPLGEHLLGEQRELTTPPKPAPDPLRLLHAHPS